MTAPSIHCSNKGVIDRLLPANYESFHLLEFLEQRTNIQVDQLLVGDDNETTTTTIPPELWQTVIVPLASWPLTSNGNGPRQRPQNLESLSSVVDHAIWTLVERRERLRQHTNHNAQYHHHHLHNHYSDARNVLCQGYSMASSSHSGTRSSTIRPGMVLLKLNSSVDFIKTSEWGRCLHRLVGDDTLRALLLHTCILVPLFSSDKEGTSSNRNNFLHLVGPPLTSISSKPPAVVISQEQQHQRQENNKNTTKTSSSRRRRRRSKRKSVAGDSDKRDNKQQAARHLGVVDCVSKSGLFSASQNHAYVPAPGLPSNHLLNRSKDVRLLLESFVEFCCGDSKQAHSKARKGRMKVAWAPICDSIVKRHKQCDYARTLTHYCPLPSYIVSPVSERIKSEHTSQVELAQVSGDFTPEEQVISFSKSIIARLFPEEIWGCQHNLSLVLQQVTSFIQLRRQENLSTRVLMKGIQITKIRWLFANKHKGKVSAKDHQDAHRMLSHVLKWVLQDVLVPLLRVCFHATESEFSGRQVLFYRKPVWSLFTALSMKKLAASAKKQYRALSLQEAALRLAGQEMGLSRLRLLPKATGVRPIAILSAPAKIKKRPSTRVTTCQEERDDRLVRKKQKRAMTPHPETLITAGRKVSTNAALNDTFAVLCHHHKTKPDLFGSGVAGLHFFYPRYKGFMEELQKSQNSKTLYFASVDIKGCYDNINQEALLQLVEQLVQNDDYVVQRVGVAHAADANVHSIHRLHVDVEPPELLKPVGEILKTMNHQYHDAIFRDTMNNAIMNKKRLLDQLTEHLKSHLVVWRGRFNEQFLIQTKGIPQGSILSSFLCNAYYGSLVEKCLGLDSQSNGELNLLSRMMDDYLFISDSLEGVQQFLCTMDKGEPDLGATINKDKTQVSCSISFRRDDGESVSLGECSTTPLFPWCGMLFDTRTGEVRIDYSRFYDGTNAGNGLTISSSSPEGDQLARQMKLYVRPRCLPILFDPTINSFQVLCVNFYQLFMLGAVKLAFYLDTCKSRGIEIQNTDYVLACIESTISFAFGMVRSRLDCNGSHFAMRYNVCQFLAWHAFRDTFLHIKAFSKLSSSLEAKCYKFKSIRNRDGLMVYKEQARQEVDLGRLLDTLLSK